MPAKIFISCGQDTDAERLAAREASSWLASQGFVPYIAITVQSIPDLNQGIIGELKQSDYFLFVNFRRELLQHGSDEPIFRGSLYTNQELAIAYALGFQQMIFLNQQFAERRGMFGTIVSNSPEFDRYTELLPVLQNAVRDANWRPTFSRNLVPESVRWSEPVYYSDHAIWLLHEKPARQAKMLILTLANRRHDRGAISTSMRLKSVEGAGVQRLAIPDNAPLKVTGHLQEYTQIIWPDSSGEFDLLALDLEDQERLFLNSLNDMSPRRPVISGVGEYRVVFQAFAEGFPIVDIPLRLTVTGNEYPHAELVAQ
jgi:hypothetical protein